MSGGDSRSCAAMSKSYSRGVGAWCCSRTKSPESGGCKNLNGDEGGVLFVAEETVCTAVYLLDHTPLAHHFSVISFPLPLPVLRSRRVVPLRFCSAARLVP